MLQAKLSYYSYHKNATCVFPGLHTCQLPDSHQTFPNSKDAQAKYIILMDGFINSKALELLNSALKSFTMVCNLLIGIYESSLRGKMKEANFACWRHRAPGGFCRQQVRRGVLYLSLSRPLIWLCWGQMPTQAGKLPSMAIHVNPLPKVWILATAADNQSGHSTPCAHPLLKK